MTFGIIWRAPITNQGSTKKDIPVTRVIFQTNPITDGIDHSGKRDAVTVDSLGNVLEGLIPRFLRLTR